MRDVKMNIFIDRVMYFVTGQYYIENQKHFFEIEIAQPEGSIFNIVKHLNDETLKKIKTTVILNCIKQSNN